MEQKKMAYILKIFSIISALIGGLFFFWYLPTLIGELATMYPETAYLREPAIFSLVMMAMICYYALWNFWKICLHIEKKNSFCMENAEAMKRIALSAGLIFIMIILGTIFLATMGYLNGAWMCICLFSAFVAGGLAVICFALATLIHSAAILKEENDLTI